MLINSKNTKSQLYQSASYDSGNSDPVRQDYATVHLVYDQSLLRKSLDSFEQPASNGNILKSKRNYLAKFLQQKRHIINSVRQFVKDNNLEDVVDRKRTINRYGTANFLEIDCNSEALNKFKNAIQNPAGSLSGTIQELIFMQDRSRSANDSVDLNTSMRAIG